MASLEGKKVVVLVTSGVEEVELTRPLDYFCSMGADVTVVTPKKEELAGVIHSKNGVYDGNSLYADMLLSDVNPNDYDAIYIPGGSSPDHLRLAPGAVDFVKAFRDKLIFAICHGPQLLISADVVRGRTITSWPSLEIDLKNAGANWVNQEVVVDGNIITSSMPSDIPAFCQKMAEALTKPEDFKRKAA